MLPYYKGGKLFNTRFYLIILQYSHTLVLGYSKSFFEIYS